MIMINSLIDENKRKPYYQHISELETLIINSIHSIPY